MPARRNPFNENVNRLMDKIFSGKETGILPAKYQEEAVPQQNAGILHDTKPKKKRADTGKTGRKPSALPGGKEKEGIFLTDMDGAWAGNEVHISDRNPERGSHKGEGKKELQHAGGGRTGQTEHNPRPHGWAGKRQEGTSKSTLESSLRDIRNTTERIRETTRQMQQMTLKMWADTMQPRVPEQKTYGEERIVPREVLRGRDTAPPSAPTVVSRVFMPQYRMEEVLDDSVPERIRECKAFARGPQGCRMTKEELFYRQAQMMEDYEDDCLYPGEFTWYFPTYQAMNAAQLRGYFSWRTQVRQGNVTPAPLSFAFVYVYELLHQIGVPTAEEGYSALKKFWEHYREYDLQLDRYMKGWLCDYVVYYNLGSELLMDSQEMVFDRAMLAFLHPEEGGDQEYFTAICALSKYNMEGSKFYKENAGDVCRVTCGVFRALTAYYEKHGKKTLAEKYFGTLAAYAYQMFPSAVFYDHKKYGEYEYEIDPIHRYRCVNGHWSCEKYFGSRAKNKDMGRILRAIDAQMRERYEYKALLKPEGMTKLVMNIIDKEINRLLEEKEKNAVPVIEIDVSKLSGIRRAAELTRERLIVEGSEEDTGEGFGTKYAQEPGAVEGTAQGDLPGKEPGQLEFVWMDNLEPEGKIPKTAKNTVEGNAVLNDAELTLLRSLLEGIPYEEYLRERHLMLSVVVDAVNEKLYEHFGDTVIVFDGEVPEVLEDYAQEAAALVYGA